MSLSKFNVICWIPINNLIKTHSKKKKNLIKTNLVFLLIGSNWVNTYLTHLLNM